MGTRGPIGKDRAHRHLTGNARRAKMPPAQRPGGAELPPCPGWLSKDAREFWAQVVPQLQAQGVLVATDWPSLVTLCQAWAEFKDATGVLEKKGRYYTAPGGQECPHPAVKMQMQALSRVNKIMEQFGLQPTSRARLPRQEAKAEDRDSYEEFRTN